MGKVFGIDIDAYNKTRAMLDEAVKTNESLRLFEDEAIDFLEAIKLNLESWVTLTAGGSSVASYADDKERFQTLMRRLMADLDSQQMIKLEADEVAYLLEFQDTLTDRLFTAKFGFDLATYKEMMNKFGLGGIADGGI